MKRKRIGQWLFLGLGFFGCGGDDAASYLLEESDFGPTPALSTASENLHVVERFTRLEDGDLLYSFTVEDPTIWTEPWSGEYLWPGSDDRLYEYACISTPGIHL